MEQRRRDYLVARICAGYLRLEIKPGIYLIVKPLTVQQRYELQEIHSQAYDRGFEENLLTEEEVMEIMRENKFWTDLDDQRMEKIPKDIDKMKINLYESFLKKEKREEIRKVLRKAEEQLKNTMLKKHMYDTATCEGYASYYKWNWMIENCTYYEDGSKYDWGHASISDVLSSYQTDALAEADIRELSRTEPWRSIWSAGKKIGDLFGRPSVELTDEQRILVSWSALYDSVAESGECPSEPIIEDDDALDGWLLFQREKREKQTSQSNVENMIGNEKIANSGEVFIVTGNDDEDINQINSLNDSSVLSAKKSRFKAIKNSRGAIEEQNLPDVRHQLKMEANNQYKDKIKGM